MSKSALSKQVRLTPELWALIDAEAERASESYSITIRAALEEGLPAIIQQRAAQRERLRKLAEDF